MKKDDTTCEICNKKHWTKYNHKLVKCKNCGLIRANNTYSDKNLIDLYQHAYYFGEEYIDYINDRQSLEKNFKTRIDYLQKQGYLNTDSHVIEIGSAYGFFLNLIKNKCKSATGFDITKEGVDYAKNNFQVDAICGDFLKYDGKKVDLICMWDVIEHLSVPGAFVKKISESLRPNGKLILTTGDIGSLLAKLQGNSWRMIHPPTHLFYFDKNSIRNLLKNNGLSVKSIRYTSTYRNVGSVLSKLKLGFLVKILSILNLQNKYFGVNTFDIMEVVAIKN